MKYSITTRTVYAAKHGKGQIWRGTLEGACSWLAWKLVFDKYGYTYELSKKTGNVEAVAHNPPGLDCECSDEYNEYSYAKDENCPIHDRKKGYLRRLHNRLAKMLVCQYRQEAKKE